MKYILITLLLFAVQLLSAQTTEVKSQVNSVTIYHNGALVNRSFNIKLEEGMNEISIPHTSSKIIMNSLQVKNNDLTVLNKSLLRKLTKEEMNQLLDRKEALSNQLMMLNQKFNDADFISNVQELETMTNFYGSKILELKKNLRVVEAKLEEAKKLESIKLDNENAAILTMVLASAKAQTVKVEYSYVCGGVAWSPSYDVIVRDASANTVTLKYTAKTMNQTGEDWDKVKVSLSSNSPIENPTEITQLNRPWILNNPRALGQREQMSEQSNEAAENGKIAKLEGVEYREILVPSYLETRVLTGEYSIKSNSTVFTLPINTNEIPARFYYYGFPAMDPQVYLVTELTGWSGMGYVDGVASVRYKDTDVGRTIIRFSEYADTLMLPIGKDNSVYMLMEPDYNKTFSKVSGKRTKADFGYNYILKNNNNFPIQFELVDQVPVSQVKTIEVKVNNISGATFNEEEGSVVWKENIAANDDKKFALSYSVDYEGGLSFASSGYQKQKYRTIACPSF